MKNYIIIVLLLFYSSIFSQNDTKAEKLLNKVSKKIDSSNTYSIDFTYSIEKEINSDGRALISKEKYYLDFMGIIQICDSKFVYTIVPENEEIMISEISKENLQSIPPSKLLSFYREGYFVKWHDIKIDSNPKIQYVKLTPIDSDSEISHLLLGINTFTNDIYKLIEIGKNQTKTILKVDSILYNVKIKEDKFIFNKENYKDYYIEEI
jgi:outer membrane lipoprotein-sorting protein